MSNFVDLYFWSKMVFFLCVPATKAKCILFLNYRNRKVVGGKHNILVHYVDVCAPNLFVAVFCNFFKWDILWLVLIKNLVICVPASTAKWILFRNHRNRKVVGGKHNVLIHYADASAPDPKSIALCNPSNEIFCGSFWSNMLFFVCLPH